MDNLAHKMLHTFEKMDAINPTFELIPKIQGFIKIEYKPIKQL